METYTIFAGVNLIRKYIEENISFNQETTLSGRSIINNINKAKWILCCNELYRCGKHRYCKGKSCNKS